MSQNNGHANGAALSDEELAGKSFQPPDPDHPLGNGTPVTRTQLRTRPSLGQNRTLIIAGGFVVLALIVFAVVSAPHGQTSHPQPNTPKQIPESSSNEKSIMPVTDSGHPVSTENQAGYVNEKDIARTATKKEGTPPLQPRQNVAGSLGAIPPFGDQPWQAPRYQPNTPITTQISHPPDNGLKALEKSSLVFIRSGNSEQSKSALAPSPGMIQVGLGLPVGTRLRAKLESSASTAVHTPILAVVEYNYESNGEIIVPAGAKAVGQIQEADSSGYMRIQFDTLLLPDGTAVGIQAAATNLDMRPLKGRVEGKNTGKNILVRSLSGLGEAGALLVGHGSLNQPLNESDLIRERVSNNVGQASDEQLARLAVTSRVVVTIPAGGEVYVVMEQSSKPIASSNPVAPSSNSANLDQLRQLLQLQQELGSQAAKQQ